MGLGDGGKHSCSAYGDDDIWEMGLRSLGEQMVAGASRLSPKAPGKAPCLLMRRMMMQVTQGHRGEGKIAVASARGR